jgi:hypothetical protein
MCKPSTIFVVLALGTLTGCGIAARVNARHDMEASKAAYKACLVENSQNVSACGGWRRAYEADLSGYQATAAATRPQPVYSNQEPASAPLPQMPEFGQPVISSQDCIGPVVAGVCHGVPKAGAPTATCYGQMLNGMCTGPMF